MKNAARSTSGVASHGAAVRVLGVRGVVGVRGREVGGNGLGGWDVDADVVVDVDVGELRERRPRSLVLRWTIRRSRSSLRRVAMCAERDWGGLGRWSLGVWLACVLSFLHLCESGVE